MAPFDNMNTNQANTGEYQTNSPWNNNFSGQLNDMLAPYQQMAQRFQSPYMTMSPNSWLARNHPQVAGVLDNAFLSGAMTPGPQGPEGVGGGVSRMMQGLMGGTQARRQQQIQNAMLPMQMAGPGLQMMDTMSQINERNAMVPFRMAQEKYMQSRDENYQSMIAGRDRQKALAGPDLTDDKGGTWSRVFDPMSGATRLYNPVLQKHADELPAGQQPTFADEKRQTTRSGMTQLERMVDSEDAANVAMGKPPLTPQQRNARMVEYSNQMAGGRAGAVLAVTDPPKDLKTFVAGERTAAYGNLPKPMTSNAFQTSMIDQSAAQDPAAQKDVASYWKNPQATYEKYLKGMQGQRQQLDKDFAEYQSGSAPRKSISFSAFQDMTPEEKTKYGGSAPNPAPSPSSPTSNKPAVNKDWTYPGN
jgi:hypothetical protein